jgi:PadR family transcriptional regulator
VKKISTTNNAIANYHVGYHYMAMIHISKTLFNREIKKGSAGLLILSLIEHRPRHGYEISKLIEERSGGALKFHVASLYPLLYRLEKRGLIQGRWVEKAGQRRRRYYRLTVEGRKILKEQRSIWRDFVQAMNLITGEENA